MWLAAAAHSPYDWRAQGSFSGCRPPHRQPTASATHSLPMNKADLVNLVAARTELTKTDVSLVVDAAIETIIDSVVEGKKVSILGFGSFEPRERSARQGLNPKTGEKIKIPAKRVPAFTAGKMFKDRVQG
ncbi:HU family DNA-binding protein [Synechococcus sp. RS9916]|uniref:HU family DNA-binding protein n=2 Tax=Synechococcus TaxID=1129 RepID=UPI0021018735|nr:HU family DNA-binding protein [Synechococcus sp. RS9916]